MTTARVHVCPTCSRSFASGELHCPFDGARLDLGERNDDPMIGQIIGGRYSVISRLGSGGMGVVYRGVQAQLDRPVALKILNSTFNTDSQVEERFRTEARAASQLTNPHTVTVYDFGATQNGALFIAMQLVEGESLRARIGRGPVAIPAALSIAAQVCESLAEAHAHRPQIIHRDIKPDNIMVRETPSGPYATVLDFGLARFSDGQRLTATNNVIGTPAYMSPEQARGGGEVDVRADLYALGIVLCEMLTGRPPFESTDPVQLLFKQAFDKPPSLRELNPALNPPEELERIVSALLAKSPADRPETAEVLRSWLLNLLQVVPTDPSMAETDASLATVRRQSPWPAATEAVRRPTPRPVLAPAPVSAAPSKQEHSQGTAEIIAQASRLRRQNRVRVALIAVVVLVAGAAIGWTVWSHSGTPAPVAPVPQPVPVAQVPPPPPPPPPVVAPPPPPAPVVPVEAAAKPAEAPPPPPDEKPKPRDSDSVSPEDLEKLKL